MVIAEQFAGLQMDQLIGAPLRAAADASLQLADSTADFIRRVGFDGTGKVRTVAFGYQRYGDNEDGTSSMDEMQISVPMLAVMPIPNLQVDEVNLDFDIEVKQSERLESAMELNAGTSGKLGALKVGITGSISAHQTHTRGTDNSAKYHVNIRAANHGIPEGLARTLDIIAANMTPIMTGSALKDGNGQELSGPAREKAEQCKMLRSEIARSRRRLRAAREGLAISIEQFKRLAAAQLNVYRENAEKIRSGAGGLSDWGAEEQDSQVRQQLAIYAQEINTVSQSWEILLSRAEEFIRILADSREEQEGVAKMFALKAIDQWGNITDYTGEQIYYDNMAAAQKNAVKSQQIADRMEDELLMKRAEYSKVMQFFDGLAE